MDAAETLLELINHKLDLVLLRLDEIEREAKDMSAQLDRIKAQVEKSTTVTQSAVALINGLAEQIRQLKDDPALLEQLASDLDAQSSSLAKAVQDNTPAPTPPPQPGP